MKRALPLLTFAVWVGVTGCGTNEGPKTPPANAVHVHIDVASTKVALQDLEQRLDKITNKGQLDKVTSQIQSQVNDAFVGNGPGINIGSDIGFISAPDSGVTNKEFIRDADNLTSLLQMARSYSSPDALNYMDKLTAELNFAANLKGGRYYGLSHIEGNGKEIDSFVSQ